MGLASADFSGYFWNLFLKATGSQCDNEFWPYLGHQRIP